MARLIDADALKHTFQRWTNVQDYNKAEQHIIRAAMIAVDDCPTVGGWISVKDRLPEKQIPVLVHIKPYSDNEEDYIEHVGMAYYTHSANGGFWAGTDGNMYGAIGIIHEPTHWMPLPEPPKEDDDETDRR